MRRKRLLLDDLMERIEAELFTGSGNDAVVHLPLRRFPGVLNPQQASHLPQHRRGGHPLRAARFRRRRVPGHADRGVRLDAG
ncbi:DUF6959 family protein [Streptomyces roseus]|uniref:DUF6959 family protein n=1 Tax=Streptomyces roseus TaxID=66430 RepID=UPI003F4CD1D0